MAAPEVAAIIGVGWCCTNRRAEMAKVVNPYYEGDVFEHERDNPYYGPVVDDEPKPTKRPADVFAGKGSVAGGLKARREAMEAGEPEKAAEAFKEGMKSKRELPPRDSVTGRFMKRMMDSAKKLGMGGSIRRGGE